MSRFKIVLFLVVTTLASTCLAGAWWLYTRVIGRDAALQNQIRQLQGNRKNAPDPGIKRFEKALELLRDDTVAGRDALYEMLRYFPDSSRAPEAKRIIGEINLDAMFSPNLNPVRKDYIVQPGDSLGRIAGRNGTTVECLLRANGMMSSRLQPGDHLLVFPLEFEIQVAAGDRTLTLLRNGRFFKEYNALEVRLPAGFKTAQPAGAPAPAQQPARLAAPPSRPPRTARKASDAPPAPGPGELTINDKAAWVEGRRVNSTDPRFIEADKWLMGSRAGFNIRAFPLAKPVAAVPVAAPDGSGTAPRAARTARAAATADPSLEDPALAVPETGVFLSREDIEELFTIIRTGTKVRVFK